jgi:hypothetical protein
MQLTLRRVDTLETGLRKHTPDANAKHSFKRIQVEELEIKEYGAENDEELPEMTFTCGVS